MLAVARKELLEMRRMELARMQVTIAIGLILVMFGFLSWGAYMAEPEVWAWIIMVFLPPLPAFFTAYFAAESIVGERERHTLETLLASPLGEYEILFGKMFAHLAVFFGACLVLFAFLWLAALPAASGGRVPSPAPGAVLASLVLFVHLFMFSEGLGVFIGQRARTQATANAIVGPLFALPFMGFALLPGLGGAYLDGAVESFAGAAWVLAAFAAAATYLVVLPVAFLVLRKARAERLLA